MITQIEIDGFKTFKDFKVELAPFQVIVGPNGSGKSNLFDALHLLSRLAVDDIATAFQGLRGDVSELFTKLSNSITYDNIRIAVEMLVDRRTQDDFGKSTDLIFTRLRYELEITQGVDTYGLERLYVTYESLKSIPPAEDNWSKRNGLLRPNNWIPEPNNRVPAYIQGAIPFIATDKPGETGKATIHLYIEEHPFEHRGSIPHQADAAQRTVLSSATSITGFSHAFAAREELLSLSFFHLNPEALRQPSLTKGPRSLSSDGSNLPTTLARMRAEDKFALADVSRDMANLVRGIFKVRVEQDKASDKYVIYGETSDQRTFSAQVLSDGTLRLLALATLRNDPQFHGTLCLEEPEDGVEPLHLKVMARVLREMTTDFRDPQQVEEPLRQVLVTSHSPAFISLSEVFDSLLFTHLVTLGASGQGSLPVKATRMEQVVTPQTQAHQQPDHEGEPSTEVYTIDMVRQYLSSNDLNHARNQLKKARIHSIERKSNAS
ncbi:MAG TPA: AAA family ATPase [Ktedonobacteraceae bacterium]|nr:AAA family ATPase [Ktedonobacteraceae bacterium]